MTISKQKHERHLRIKTNEKQIKVSRFFSIRQLACHLIQLLTTGKIQGKGCRQLDDNNGSGLFLKEGSHIYAYANP